MRRGPRSYSIQSVKADLLSFVPLTDLTSAIPKNILIVHAVYCVIYKYRCICPPLERSVSPACDPQVRLLALTRGLVMAKDKCLIQHEAVLHGTLSAYSS